MIARLEQASGRSVSRETLDRLEWYADALVQENARQNLISKATIKQLWERHIVDSAQLCGLARTGSEWLDIGSGAGLPGVVLAILSGDPVTLVEPRRLRAEFLQRMVDELRITNAAVRASKVEALTGRYTAVTARAVASLSEILSKSYHLSSSRTRWILPKGRSGALELAEAERSWQGRFDMVPSQTDPEAVIIVAEQVKPRRGPKGGAER